MKYAKLFNRKSTPQSRPIPGANQERNSAGGYAWAVDGWTLLDRFLILGSEHGTYYVGENKLTLQNAQNTIKLIKSDGEKTVARIVEVSTQGLAPKNDPAIFALALAASYGDDKTRAAALQALPSVCRTGTHLFGFVAACDGLRGWGRGLRKAVGAWYNGKEIRALEYQLLKYKQREGWSNADVLRLAHPKPLNDQYKALFKWAVDNEITGEMPLIRASESLKDMDATRAAQVVRAVKLPREAIPTELLKEKEIWDALLQDMPLTAMLRNLGNLSKCGLLTVGSEAATKVAAELNNLARLQKARIHPIAILNALSTYAKGQGVKGDGQWTPVTSVVDALDAAFYKAFKNVTPTGKRFLLGLDVSGSMAGTRVNGLASLECRQAAGAMALVTLASEENVTTVAFDTKPYLLALSSRQRLDDVVNVLARTGGGGTDCSAPIQFALDKRIPVDAFVIYTDSETWAGRQHPVQALAAYRNAMQIPAKLVVVAMASNRFSIGDDADAGMLNAVGLDASAPDVIAQFLR
jgi:60 kDa SS-A/Ro ribonucleoprotein